MFLMHGLVNQDVLKLLVVQLVVIFFIVVTFSGLIIYCLLHEIRQILSNQNRLLDPKEKPRL